MNRDEEADEDDRKSDRERDSIWAEQDARGEQPPERDTLMLWITWAEDWDCRYLRCSDGDDGPEADRDDAPAEVGDVAHFPQFDRQLGRGWYHQIGWIADVDILYKIREICFSKKRGILQIKMLVEYLQIKS